MIQPPSLLERAPQANGAFLLGCGGGGDIIQTIPVMNYLRALGLRRFVLGDYAVKWWDKPGEISFGCHVLSLDQYRPSTRIHDAAIEVTAETQLDGPSGAKPLLHESVIARLFGVPVVSVGIHGGAQGVLAAVHAILHHYGLDLFIAVDIGADAFYSGEESSVQSPLADAISLYVAQEVDGVYALTGYGCDAELPLEHLERNMAQAMRQGGFLGAHGLTPKDVRDLSAVLDHFPDEAVEQWPRDAARGELGIRYCKGFWPIHVTPLAAVTLFFDPGTLTKVNPLPTALADTRSLAEAEERILKGYNVWPETRLPRNVTVPSSPQPL